MNTRGQPLPTPTMTYTLWGYLGVARFPFVKRTVGNAAWHVEGRCHGNRILEINVIHSEEDPSSRFESNVELERRRFHFGFNFKRLCLLIEARMVWNGEYFVSPVFDLVEYPIMFDLYQIHLRSYFRNAFGWKVL
ncbi:hypothetical protein TNCT_481261 [Trichonephila clavata]|uniref:Uncharacterized protein n=1 Tax=Trichonephila clavata TaxID=2740835 RepID=A0A8X6F8G2_TRICU|nr:hypothetical protein TNCT_481261 [Trichonephila clavata]